MKRGLNSMVLLEYMCNILEKLSGLLLFSFNLNATNSIFMVFVFAMNYDHAPELRSTFCGGTIGLISSGSSGIISWKEG
jgi:hypothetical protein